MEKMLEQEFPTIFYEISRKGYPTSYLFGTFHSLPRFPGDILNTDAFINATRLYLESPSDSTPGLMHALTDMDKQAELVGKLRGKNIIRLDLPEINKAVDDRLRNMPYPIKIWNYYPHPYIWYKNEDESLEAHAQGLENLKANEVNRKALKEYWLNHKPPQTEQYMEDIMLCDTRNHKWMEQIEDGLKESSFIAVGASHLHGVDEKNGLVYLLRQKGFTVKPIKMPKPGIEQELAVDEIYRRLSKDEFDLELFANNIEMALYFACESGDKERFTKLIKENQFEEEALVKAFAIASKNKNTEIVDVFFNVVPDFGQKALRYAAICAAYKSNSPLESILRRTKLESLDFNQPANDGSTPLWLLCLAAHEGNIESLRMILDAPNLDCNVHVDGYPDFIEVVSKRISMFFKDNRLLEKSTSENKPKI